MLGQYPAGSEKCKRWPLPCLSRMSTGYTQMSYRATISISLLFWAGCGPKPPPHPPEHPVDRLAAEDHPMRDGALRFISPRQIGATCPGAAVPMRAPLTRLSSDEYQSTLRSLFGDAIVDGLQLELAMLPPNAPAHATGFRRSDHRLSSAHVDAYFRVADVVATQVASGDAPYRTVFGRFSRCQGLENPKLNDRCRRAIVSRFLRRAFRRTPKAQETQHMIRQMSRVAPDQQIYALVFSTLVAPAFLYRFEHRGRRLNQRTKRLTPFELATRLSYHFWRTNPDESLLKAAKSGALSNEAGYRAAVRRIFEDPRTEATMLSFFNEWLHLTPSPFHRSPRLERLRDKLNTEELHAEMAEEVRDLLRYHIHHRDSWRTILTSPYSFAKTERLAQIYGVPIWDGRANPSRLPPAERSGLLTRAAVLATTDGSTNPFRRGAELRRRVMCEHIPPPPADLPAGSLEPPEPEAGASTRAQFAAKITGEPCATCHLMFTGVGYALEAYDGLGRYRTRERVVTADGKALGFAPIDFRSVPAIDPNDRDPITGPVDMVRKIAESPKTYRCFAERYVAFSFRRETIDAFDACTVERIAAKLESGAPVAEVLRDIALDPTFRLRRIED